VVTSSLAGWSLWVRGQPSRPRRLLDDGRAYAWLALVRRPDVSLDRRGFSWLTLVAAQEIWRQCDLARRERPAGPLSLPADDDFELPEPAGLTHDPLDRILAREIHDERVQRFAALKPRERPELLLHVAGHSYPEIAALPDSTRTAINRRLRDGRAQLRNP
jgi:DNA-directed RNA polymerase specialized sigma24 family protein